MVYFLSLFLALLLSAPSYAAYIPPSNPLTIAGTTIGLPYPSYTSKINKVLICYVVSNNGCSARDSAATSGYAPASGKKFIARALYLSASSSTASNNADIVLSYSDNDIGMNGSPPGTNPVYYGSSSAGLFNASAIANAYPTVSVYFVVPATKFVNIIGTTALAVKTVIIYGEETTD